MSLRHLYPDMVSAIFLERGDLDWSNMPIALLD